MQRIVEERKIYDKDWSVGQRPKIGVKVERRQRGRRENEEIDRGRRIEWRD